MQRRRGRIPAAASRSDLAQIRIVERQISLLCSARRMQLQPKTRMTVTYGDGNLQYEMTDETSQGVPLDRVLNVRRA
jgi:hypothetical protein